MHNDPQQASEIMRAIVFTLAALFAASPACGQTTNDPFDTSIETTEGLIVVGYEEFASLPDYNGAPARMMLMVDEPGTGRMFVNDMHGPLYSVGYDGEVSMYVDIGAARWGIGVESGGRERGFQSFAFHPEFGQEGAPGFGKFYTWTDSPNTDPTPDFGPGPDGGESHHTILSEWTAEDPFGPSYDGGAPRELMRFQQPFGNHNAGETAFNPLAEPGDSDYGLLYVGSADGGSGGDPLNLAQDLANGFGKILRIDPLGSNSANGQYGIPDDNPFADDGDPDTLGEIFAVGVRNPQRFAWDPVTGNMFMADIGQNIVEKISLVTRGANLGWNDWEGSFGFISRTAVSLSDVRSDPSVTYPLVEYGRNDPIMHGRVAATGLVAYRGDDVPQLRDQVLFGDLPSGEFLYFSADDLPNGGNEGIRRVLLRDGGEQKTFLEVIQEKNVEQGRDPSGRADIGFGTGPDGQLFLLNKHDGVIRRLTP